MVVRDGEDKRDQRGSRAERGRHTKRTPAKAGERAEFPAIRPTWRRAGQLLQELLPAVQEPSRFGFYRIAADQAENLLDLSDATAMKDPEANKEPLAPSQGGHLRL